MAETRAEKIRRLRQERNRRRKRVALWRRAIAKLEGLVANNNRRIKRLNAALRRLEQPDVPGMNAGGWHPDAIGTQVQAPLSWSGGAPKLVWHTTEGSSLPRYSGSHPHFTLDPRTGTLWQHVPIRGGAYALVNAAGGVETNRAHAIQVELIGFAAQTASWSDVEYANVAKLARWIEKWAGVPRRCTVEFRADSTHKVGDYVGYVGHLGHQHVPENEHWDPGRFRIEKVV